MLYSFLWMIPWCLNFMCRRFGTLCLFQLLQFYSLNRQSFPKRWNIKFEGRGITQKKEYDINSTEKVLDQDKIQFYPIFSQVPL